MTVFYATYTFPGPQGPTGGSADWASPGAALGTSAAVPTGSVFVDIALTKTSTVTSSSDAAQTIALTVTPSGASTAVEYGSITTVTTTGGNSTASASVYGVSITVDHENTTAIANLIGANYGATTSTGAGNVTAMYAAQFGATHASASTVTALHHLHIYSTAKTGGGTITTNTALYIEAQTAGSTNYAIYTNSGIVRFGDNVLVGTGVTTGGRLSVRDTTSGGVVNYIVANDSNTASSTARAQILVAGSSAGDAEMNWTVSGVQQYTMGIDNSDSDAFVLSSGGALGTNNIFRANTTGFVAYNGFHLNGGTAAAPQSGYTTFSNLVTDRTCDANATTVEELADILGTLIVDLKAKGIVAA